MRKFGTAVAILVTGITLASLVGCAPSQNSAIEINSAKALSVNASQAPTAQRIIALANGSAEIISALGYKSALIGRDVASTDSDLANIPIVTSGHLVVAEKIIALKPDLVLIDKSTGPSTALSTLRKAKINIQEIPEAWKIGDISKKVLAIAAAIGALDSGRKLDFEISSAIANSTPRNLAINKRPGVVFLYLRGGSAIYLIGGKGSGADSIIAAMGGVDLGAAKLANPFNALSAELIAALNPDVILVMTKGLQSVGGVTGLTELPGIAQTLAGKSKRIIAVDDSLLLSFGPRTPDLLIQLQSALADLVAK